MVLSFSIKESTIDELKYLKNRIKNYIETNNLYFVTSQDVFKHLNFDNELKRFSIRCLSRHRLQFLNQ